MTGHRFVVWELEAVFSTIKLLPMTILLYEPRCEKTGLRGFRPGPTQIGLCS